jgi:hypothetical protein
MRAKLDPTSKTIKAIYAMPKSLRDQFARRARQLGYSSSGEAIRMLMERWLRQTEKIQRLRR